MNLRRFQRAFEVTGVQEKKTRNRSRNRKRHQNRALISQLYHNPSVWQSSHQIPSLKKKKNKIKQN